MEICQGNSHCSFLKWWCVVKWCIMEHRKSPDTMKNNLIKLITFGLFSPQPASRSLFLMIQNDLITTYKLYSILIVMHSFLFKNKCCWIFLGNIPYCPAVQELLLFWKLETVVAPKNLWWLFSNHCKCAMWEQRHGRQVVNLTNQVQPEKHLTPISFEVMDAVVQNVSAGQPDALGSTAGCKWSWINCF